MTTDEFEGGSIGVVRPASSSDAELVARLLHDFNEEFDRPTPGPDVLSSRLRRLLSGEGVVALLVGEPAVGLAVLSFRPNVWYDGPVAVLDELYVHPALRGRGLGSTLLDAACDLVRQRGGELLEINVDGDDTDARRFYEARGFSNSEPDNTDPLLYYYSEL